MKNIVISCVCVLLCQVGFGQGMDFAHLTLDEALAKAGEENKLVFVDAYTSWCGPCKKMSRNVFPNAQVGDYFNANFVNLKIDMEKGEGPSVAKRYGVRSYPTYLFLDESGGLIHRSGGYRPPTQFIQVGQEAMSPEKQLSILSKKIQSDEGKRDLSSMYKYAMMALETGDPKGEQVALDFMNEIDNHQDIGYQELMLAYGKNTDSEFFQDIIANRQDFERIQGAEFMSNYIKGAVMSKLMRQLNTSNPQQAASFVSKYASGDDAKALDQVYRIYYNQLNKNEKEVESAADKLVKIKSLGPIESELLHTLGQYYLATKTDEADLNNAIRWVNKSVELKPGVKNYSTLAALYDKIGDSGMARQYQVKAKSMIDSKG